jgi:DNA-directed RNA polymerase sigma subunit (sigma70/sigma32)
MGRQGSPFAAELPRLEQRNAEIVRRYRAGEELASIGVDLDLTRERIRQIVRSAGAWVRPSSPTAKRKGPGRVRSA